MNKSLKISDELSLPLDAITQTFGVVAQRGAGKTYLTAVLCEELAGASLPFVVVDPMGVYYGLRSSADGKREGLPIIILGGEHGDVPLESTSGKVIADWVASERRSAVLDLSSFGKNEQRRFVTDFAEQIYQRNREPLHLILDEADMWAPQRPKGVERMLGAIEDLVRRGRARGIGLSLVTQRPAVLNKDVLTQVSVLIALRIVGPQDREAVEAWIKYHGEDSERKEVLTSLASLPIGTAWFWSPGWLGILQKVEVRKRHTFDSSATPKLGERVVQPQKLASVDLNVLRDRIAATIERAKQEDPKELRRQIAELKKRQVVNAVAVAVDSTALERAVEKNVAVATREFDQRFNAMERQYEKALADLRGRLHKIAALASVNGDSPHTSTPSTHIMREKSPAPPVPSPMKDQSLFELEAPALKILNVIATLNVRGIPVAKETVARWLAIHPNGGRFNRNLAALRAGLYLDGFTLTDAGRDAAEAMETGLEAALAVLPEESMRTLLRAIINAGAPLSKDQLAEVLGIHPNGGRFNRNLAWLRTMGVITERGPIEATPGLFE